MLRRLSLFATICLLNLTLFSQNALDNFNAMYTELLSNYVKEGSVNYQGVKTWSKRADLQKYLKAVRKTDLVGLDQQKAFFINAYNALVIESIAEHYPVSSPQGITSFFDKKSHELYGEKSSLNQIEKAGLQEFNDARLHFALVCAAKSCPPIQSALFTENNVNELLDFATMKAVNDNDFISYNSEKNSANISKIFEWYKNDFLVPDKGSSVLDFINLYKTDKIAKDSKVTYKSYDWTLNDQKNAFQNDQDAPAKSLQSFTQSTLLDRGGWEYKFFNATYTQTSGYSDIGVLGDLNERSNFFSSIHQFTYGINPKINVGFDFWYKASRNNGINDSPFEVLKFTNDSISRSGITGIGPKVKFIPFNKLGHLAVQSTFLFPTQENMESRGLNTTYLSNDAYLWITQIMYDFMIGSNFQIFTQVSPWVYFAADPASSSFVSTPVSAFLSYFATPRITVYLQAEYWPNLGNDPIISSYFVQNGVGLKYQIIPNFLEVEASTTKFILGKSVGAGSTYNLGFRLIRLGK